MLDRDVNSAITILQRFLARLGPHMFAARMAGACGVLRASAVINTFEHVVKGCDTGARGLYRLQDDDRNRALDAALVLCERRVVAHCLLP